MEDAAAKAAAVLRAGAEQAPDTSSFVGDAIRGYWHHTKQFWIGAGEATWGLGEFVFTHSNVYALIDPEGYVENMTSLAQGLIWGAQHPVEFGKAIIDWETWKTTPSRAMGHLLPDAILTAATAGAGGAGVAASRGASAASRLSRVADDVADIAEDMEDAGDAARASDRLAPERPLGNQPDGSWLGEEHGVPFRLSPDANAAVERLMSHAADAEPRITREVTSVIDRSEHSQPVGLDKSLKSEESLKRKVATLLESDRNLNADQALSRMRDAVRYTMATPPEHYASDVQHAVRGLQAHGFENVKFPDPTHAWSNPEGYKGLNTAWRDPQTGQTFEVQFHTPQSFEAKEATHSLYGTQRVTSDATDIARLEAEQARIFREVEVPRGVESITLRQGEGQTNGGS